MFRVTSQRDNISFLKFSGKSQVGVINKTPDHTTIKFKKNQSPPACSPLFAHDFDIVEIFHVSACEASEISGYCYIGLHYAAFLP
jgi:hypothetical protein